MRLVNSIRGKVVAIFIVALCLFCFQVINLQAAPKIAVELRHGGTDSVGNRLADQIKEDVRKISRLRIAVKDEPRMVLSISTTDLEMGVQKGTVTVYGVAWYLEPSGMFLGHFAGACGSDRVKAVAKDLVVKTEKLVH
jgi:hypothetical protein